jgi:predicted transposase YdaD
MPQADTPFKLLVSEFAPDFAAWLLDVDEADVRRVQPLNIELPAGAVRTDAAFRVTLADGRVTLLHVEFQGRRSERPMPLRMLDYLSRLAQQESGYLCSAVLYVGDGAGAGDEGTHRVDCADGGLTLAWRYRVIRLWQMRAEELLALGRPALLALIGQTRIEEPERVLPQVVAIIRQTPDEGERIRLLAALTSLMRDEEVLKMAERLVEAMERDLMLDTPFLRRIREEGRAEGLAAMRQGVLDVLAERFDPPATHYRRIQAQLETITDLEQLRALLQAAIRATDVADFEQALEA